MTSSHTYNLLSPALSSRSMRQHSQGQVLFGQLYITAALTPIVVVLPCQLA